MADVLYEREQTQEDAAAPTGRKEITAERYLSRDILDQEWEHLSGMSGYTTVSGLCDLLKSFDSDRWSELPLSPEEKHKHGDSVMRSMAIDMDNGRLQPVNDTDGDYGVKIFGIPILIRGDFCVCS